MDKIEKLSPFLIFGLCILYFSAEETVNHASKVCASHPEI